MRDTSHKRRVTARVLFIVVVLALLIAAISYSILTSEKVETIRVSGAWALYPMMVTWGEEYESLNPELRVDISGGGAGQGMTDVLSGLTDIGMVSREIFPEEISQGAFWVSVAKDGVVVTVNRNNPVLDELMVQGVTVEQFIGIWITGDITDWGEVVNTTNADSIHVLSRADACGAAQTWAKYLGYYQGDLLGTEIVGDPGVAAEVARDSLALGYNNVNYAYNIDTGEPATDLAIVPIDLNGNGQVDEDENFYQNKSTLIDAIKRGDYPSPPARDLNLVTKGKPSGGVKDFLTWILTDGQEYVADVGYVPLSHERLELELAKLEE